DDARSFFKLADFLAPGLVLIGLGDVVAAVENSLGKFLPVVASRFVAAMFGDIVLEFFAEGLIGLLPPGNANDRGTIRQVAVFPEVEERGNEFSRREVARRPKDQQRGFFLNVFGFSLRRKLHGT